MKSADDVIIYVAITLPQLRLNDNEEYEYYMSLFYCTATLSGSGKGELLQEMQQRGLEPDVISYS